MSNDMSNSMGRLGNHIIRALAASFISEKNNMKFNYGPYYNIMTELGIKLFTDGTNMFDTVLNIKDKDLEYCIDNEINSNINVDHSYFQTYYFSNYLYNYYKNPNNRESIIKANKFSVRYKNNNDVFVHVRLTDATQWNQGFDYYDRALSNLTYENGYIASDDLNHDICKRLMQKYNLSPIIYNEVDTIMFGSTCKQLVLTGGSFSYAIGLFGFFSKVYYLKAFNIWYPAELFHINDWTEIVI
jgi:hypothetical protein